MKTLIKVLLPLTLASTLFVGCGDDGNKVKCGNATCNNGEVCAKVDANSEPACKPGCIDGENNTKKCQDNSKTCSDSADTTPVKYCK